jgi:hypothetical protein
MCFLSCHRRWSSIGRTGTTVLFVWALCNCGSSSLKSPQTDADVDVPGSGSDDLVSGPVAGAGGTVLGAGGGSGQSGSTMATGGSVGPDGAIDSGGGGGGAVGGRTGTGGVTSAGGVTSIGGRTGTGGTGIAGAGGSSVGGPVATMLKPLGKAFCTAALNCCLRDGFYVIDLTDCEAKFPSRLRPYPLAEQGIVTVDTARLAACVSAYEKAATTCTITEVDAACQGVWLGTRAEGQPCGGTIAFGAFECKAANGSAACYWADDEQYPANPGVCVALPRGRAGDLCGKSCKTNHDCIMDVVGNPAPLPVTCFEEDGLYCAVAANPPVCRPFLKAGDPCTYDPGCCGRENYCDWQKEVCRPAAKLGEACGEVYCVDGLGCGEGQLCYELTLTSDKVCKGTPALP